MKWAVVDSSGTIPTADLLAYAAAQQRQLREHLAACYDGDGAYDTVRVIASEAELATDESPIRIQPTAPDMNTLGVHDRLPDGRPACNVYLDLVAKFGDAWTAIASHEVLEARIDPRLHACVEFDDGTIWDREICDRVEADSYGIDVGSSIVIMSNFNTPECFEPPAVIPKIIVSTPSERGFYDWMGLSTYPNEIRPGGYAQIYDPRVGWTMRGAMRGYRAELAMRGLSRGTRRARRELALRARAK